MLVKGRINKDLHTYKMPKSLEGLETYRKVWFNWWIWQLRDIKRNGGLRGADIRNLPSCPCVLMGCSILGYLLVWRRIQVLKGGMKAEKKCIGAHRILTVMDGKGSWEQKSPPFLHPHSALCFSVLIQVEEDSWNGQHESDSSLSSVFFPFSPGLSSLVQGLRKTCNIGV